MDIALRHLDLAEFPELEENPYHPQNDEFARNNEQVKRMIMAHQSTMTPKHVQVVKLHHQGMTNVKVAEVVNFTPATVGNVLRRADARRLGDLLAYFEASLEGPSVALRKAMLHRIATDNEKTKPTVAIQAIAEQNKMDVQRHNIENDGGGSPNINITINQNVFPRTILDGD